MTKILQGLKSFFSPNLPKIILAVLVLFANIGLYAYVMDAIKTCLGPNCPEGFIGSVLKAPLYILFFPVAWITSLINDVFNFPYNQRASLYLFYGVSIIYGYFFSCLLITLWRKIFSRR